MQVRQRVCGRRANATMPAVPTHRMHRLHRWHGEGWASRVPSMTLLDHTRMAPAESARPLAQCCATWRDRLLAHACQGAHQKIRSSAGAHGTYSTLKEYAFPVRLAVGGIGGVLPIACRSKGDARGINLFCIICDQHAVAKCMCTSHHVPRPPLPEPPFVLSSYSP